MTLSLIICFQLRIFEKNDCDFQDNLFKRPDKEAIPTFESNIAYILRFMIDNKVSGMSWVKAPAGKYRILHDKTVSRCQLEIQIR